MEPRRSPRDTPQPQATPAHPFSTRGSGKKEQAASAHLDIRLAVPELVHHERHARARTRLARRKRAHMRGEPGEERTHGSRRRARRMRGDEPGRPRRRDLSDLPPRHGAR